MKIQSVRTRNQALGLEDIRTKLINITGSARIISSRLDTSGERTGLHFEAFYIISLPAMHAEVKILKLSKDFFSINSKFRITILCNLVCPVYKFRFHNMLIYRV